MIKTAKLKIVKPTNTDWSALGAVINDLDYVSFKIKNQAIMQYHMLMMNEFKYNNENDDKMNAKKRKELFGYSTYESVIYKELKPLYEEYGFHSEVIPGLIKSSSQAYKKVLKDMLRGTAVLPTFKRQQPVPVRSRQIKVIDRDTLSLSIINAKRGKDLGITTRHGAYPFDVKIASKKSYAKLIMDRIIDGRYEICDSHIQRQGKHVFIQLAFKDTQVQHHALDPDKFLGIDLGVTKAATMAVSNSKQFDFIEGGEITAFRERVEAQRVSKRNQLRYASENRRGHGRRTLLKPLEVLESKVENFKNLTNHRYSKYIVDFAIKNGCGTIQMEDLTGISRTHTFLSTWSYFDLQTKVKYKAEAAGINVILIPPSHTSQRCHECGYIDKSNRQDQETFQCVNCNHKTNADVNAAKNIAIENIDAIIKQQLDSQKAAEEKIAALQ